MTVEFSDIIVQKSSHLSVWSINKEVFFLFFFCRHSHIIHVLLLLFVFFVLVENDIAIVTLDTCYSYSLYLMRLMTSKQTKHCNLFKFDSIFFPSFHQRADLLYTGSNFVLKATSKQFLICQFRFYLSCLSWLSWCRSTNKPSMHLTSEIA